MSHHSEVGDAKHRSTEQVEPVNFDEVYAHAPDEGAFGPAEWKFRQCVRYVEESIPRANLRALDIGSGDGRHATYLAQRNWTVTGVDGSRVGLAKTKRKLNSAFKGVHHVFCDGEEDGFMSQLTKADLTADLVMSATFLDHLEDGLRPKVEKIIRGLVSPGSYLYLALFSDIDPGSSGIFSAQPSLASDWRSSDTIGAVKHFYSYGQVVKDLQSELRIVYASQAFEEAFEPPLHHHGFINILGRRAY